MQLHNSKLSNIKQHTLSEIQQSIVDIRFDIHCGEIESAFKTVINIQKLMNEAFENHQINKLASDEFKTLSLITACAYSDMKSGFDISAYMSGDLFDQDGQDLAYWKAEYAAKKATKLEILKITKTVK